jgi:hypothetical protein
VTVVSPKDPELTTPFAFRTVVLVAVLAFAAGCMAAVAQAQAQEAVPPPQRTIVATGNGSAIPKPADRTRNASIVAAVKQADAKALPLAVADARAQAADLAGATGTVLGPLLSVSNAGAANGIYGSIVIGGVGGTFGPGQFCGNVRSRPSHVDAQGVRRFGKVRTRHTCRVPSTVQRAVTLTFAIG